MAGNVGTAGAVADGLAAADRSHQVADPDQLLRGASDGSPAPDTDGLGYVEAEGQAVTDAFVAQGKFEIEIACDRIPAKATLGALYDPKSERVKA